MCLRVGVGVRGCVRESLVCNRKSIDETAGRATHLFFLVEALFVTVRKAEASRVQHVVDLQAVHDAVYLPSAWPLTTQQTCHHKEIAKTENIGNIFTNLRVCVEQ